MFEEYLLKVAKADENVSIYFLFLKRTVPHSFLDFLNLRYKISGYLNGKITLDVPLKWVVLEEIEPKKFSHFAK